MPNVASILDKPAVRRAALPITVQQYHMLGRAGIIADNTELLRGVIVEKMIKSPLHSWTVQFLADWLRAALGPGFVVRQEQPLTLADSEPEPDIAVVAGTADDFQSTHPSEARLVMEVAIATLELDREKATVYAAVGIPEFWLVLPEHRSVEVHTSPGPSGYACMARYHEQDVIPLSGFENVTLELAKLFS